MEYSEKYKQEDRNTPNLAGKNLVGFIRRGHFKSVFVFVFYNGSEVFRYVFISRVGYQSFEVVAENRVVKGLFERGNHSYGFLVHFNLNLVALNQLDCVEQGIFYFLTLERDFYVAYKVVQCGIAQNRNALADFFAFVIGFVHKLFQAFFFKSRNFNYRHAQSAFEFVCVDFVARFFNHIHHVEGDYHGNVYFHNLGGKVKIAFEVCRVYDIDNAVGFFVKNVISCYYLFGRVGRKRINTG